MGAVAKRQLSAWKPSTVVAPASVAGILGVLLATFGYSLVGFGIATVCTDWHVTDNGCDAMYRWMHIGVIGQWVLVIIVILLLVVGLILPRSRKIMAISIWAISPLALAWFVFYMYSARHTF